MAVRSIFLKIVKKTMNLTDIISLAGVITSFVALIISFGVLLRLNQNASRAKEEAELRIRPITFVKEVNVNLEEDNDSIKSMTLKVSNMGLGAALNLNVELAENVSVPGSSRSISKDLFEASSLLQVLPNTSGSMQGSFLVNVNGDTNKIAVDNTKFIPEDFVGNTAIVVMTIKKRPDGQKQLKLSALGIKKEELETSLNDALYRTFSSSMSNSPITYKNRPKRSESLVFGE